jgi:hypothetical protein
MTGSKAPVPSGGGGGQVQNDTDSIKSLAQQLQASISPKLNQAAADAGALHLAESAFTAVTYALAIAYTEASAFMIKDLRSKVDRLAEIEYSLKTTAAVWGEAGDKSTIQSV